MRLHAVFAAGILRSAPYPVSPASVPIELHALGTRLLLPVIDELFEFRFGFRLSNELASNRPILIGRLPPDRETRTARRLSLTFLLTYFFLFFLRERGVFAVRWMSGGIGWMSGGRTSFPTVFPIPFAALFSRFIHPTVRWMSGGHSGQHDLFGGLDSDQDRFLVDSFFEQLTNHVGDWRHAHALTVTRHPVGATPQNTCSARMFFLASFSIRLM